MIKWTIQEQDTTIINIYASNIGAPQYVRQMLTSMKGEINSNTIIVGDFNTLLTPMDRSTKQKINKEIQTLNDTTDQLDLIDIYRTFHPKTMNFTFFSNAHGTFSRIDHFLDHKSSLGKLKKIEIIPSIFFLFVFFLNFILLFKLYIIVLVLPNIKMNLPQVFWSQCSKIRSQLQEKNY